MTHYFNLHSFQNLQEEWEKLLPFTETDNLFLNPRWQRVWWETLGGKSELHLLSISTETEIIGIAPMAVNNDEFSFLGGTDLFDYHDFVVRKDREEEFFRNLMEHLNTQTWGKISLPSLPQQSPTLSFIPEFAKIQGWNCEITKEDVSPGITLPEDWESYLLKLTKKDRHELRRKYRRLYNTANPTHTACLDKEAIDACMDDLFHLMRLSHEEKRGFLTEERESFFRAISKEMASVNQLGLYFMEVDGIKAAGVLCFDYKNKRYLYNSGFNPIYSKLSVGLLMKATTLHDAISSGFNYFDFLRGDEDYKYDLGGMDTQLYSLTIHR